MNVIELLLKAVDVAIDAAAAGISALAKSKAEEQAHLAELHDRLDRRRQRVNEAAAEAKRIADSLPK